MTFFVAMKSRHRRSGEGAAWSYGRDDDGNDIFPASGLAFSTCSGYISTTPMPHDHSTEQLDHALATLREHGQRVTKTRKAILQLLISEHGPFTTDALHARLKDGECDLVTVYRCLAAMEEIGLVRRCDFGDGAYRYEFDCGEHHHHHVICRDCREVKTLDFCVADSLERMARQMGYANVNHTLEIFGICPKCQKVATKTAA